MNFPDMFGPGIEIACAGIRPPTIPGICGAIELSKVRDMKMKDEMLFAVRRK